MQQTFMIQSPAFLLHGRHVKNILLSRVFCADAGYRGTFVEDVKSELRRYVDISEKIKPHEWEKLPWRWVAERTFAWMNSYRRLAKDFEITVASEETMVILSCLAGLLYRL